MLAVTNVPNNNTNQTALIHIQHAFDRFEQISSPLSQALPFEVSRYSESLKDVSRSHPTWMTYYYHTPNIDSLIRRLVKRAIWLSQQPYDASDWRIPTMEEAYNEKLRQLPRWKLALQYNAIGKTSILNGLEPQRKFMWKWDQTLCLMSYRKLKWVSEGLKRGIHLSTKSTPQNPFTQKAIKIDSPHAPCEIPLDFYGADAYPSNTLPIFALPHEIDSIKN